MSIDRAAALRHAEELLQQEKLEEAIAEYLRIVEDHPRDWNTANVLGDVYVRAGDIDRGVEQFTRVASMLTRDGFYSKAGAIYRKILKLKPDDEHTLSLAADIAAKQGLLADARALLTAIRDRQSGRGEFIAAGHTGLRIAGLDPTDYDQRIAGARVHYELLDVTAAVGELKIIARELAEKDRSPEAIDALREAARYDPGDREVTRSLAALLAGRGDAASFEEAEALIADEPPGAVNSEVAIPAAAAVEPSGATAVTAGESADSPIEVQLTVVDDDVESSPPLPPSAPSEPVQDLDDVFAQLREEAAGRLSMDAAEQELQRGLTFYYAGQFEEAIPPLERAFRAPRQRFAAATALGRICRARGQVWPAIEWLERAAQAPAPSPEEGHRMLFDLADLLESAGEVARALAVCLELQAEAGAYEDVSARVQRLARVQALG